MKTDERTIITVELSIEEKSTIAIVQHLLDDVEDFLFRDHDIVENADTGEVIERNTIHAIRNLFEVLLNDDSPSNWEYPD